MNEKTKKLVEHLYVDAVLNEEPEKLTEPYVINKIAYENYEKALILLAELKGKGKCDFTYDSIYEPYIIHCIDVTWKFDADGYFEIGTKEIVSILEKMEEIVIDAQTENKWQLSSTIYYSK